MPNRSRTENSASEARDPQSLVPHKATRGVRSDSLRALRGRDDFADAPRWEELASARGVRLPAWKMRCSATWMERWLRKLDIPIRRYYEWSGWVALGDFAKANPHWPLTAWVGLLLECREEGKL